MCFAIVSQMTTLDRDRNVGREVLIAQQLVNSVSVSLA